MLVVILASISVANASTCPTTNVITAPPVFQWTFHPAGGGNPEPYFSGTLEYGDVTLNIGGETENSSKVNKLLLGGMPAALAIMLIALMFQFNSARRVLLTLMTIPLVVVGAPIALLLTGEPLSFFAILGMISLAGIIINNAIVLIDQIDIEIADLPLKEAVIQASVKRVTPILLTSLTTILGLLPMAINGGALFEPMATLMIGGLAFSSLLTLFFVPGGYYLFFGGFSKSSWFRLAQPDT